MIRIFRSMLTFSAAARAREPSSELGETAARKGHQRGGQEEAAWAALLKPSSPVASSSFRARCPGPDFCALPPPPTATARARVSRRQRLERRGGGSRGLTFLLGRGRAAAAAPTAAAAPLPHDHRLPVLVRPLSRRAEGVSLRLDNLLSEGGGTFWANSSGAGRRAVGRGWDGAHVGVHGPCCWALLSGPFL